MLKNISWNVIKGEFDRVKTEQSISDDAPITLTIVPKNSEQMTKRVRFKQFLSEMWRLYDSNREIKSVNVVKNDNNDVLFMYNTSTGVNEVKPSGDSSLITGWINLTENLKQIHINLLLRQILEDQTICEQSNSTPNSGNPS